MEKKYHILCYSLLTGALVIVLFFGVRSEKRNQTYARLMNETYEGALLSAMMQMEEMRLNIDKALVSRDYGENAVLLSRIGSDAAAVHSQLSTLPLSHVAMAEAVKLCNQLSDYAVVLLKRVGSQLLSEDAALLEQIATTCGALQQALQTAHGQMTQRKLRFEQLQQYMQDADALSRPLEGVSDNIDYPTLLYDGPFSDAVSENVPRGLKNGQVSAEEACSIARTYVGDASAQVELTQESGGTIPAWGVKVTRNDCELQLAVTKQGGDILWMFPEHAGFSMHYGLEECTQAAQRFLLSRGYGDMQLTFWQIYGGMATLSYASVQDGVILYPDLVKVQVRMDTLEVVGIEARHYLTSHVRRANLRAGVSMEEAQKALSERLEDVTGRLCVIPQGGYEYLCWEFTGTYHDNTYFVYIDAHTGQQRDIQRLVQTSIGPKAS